ncbi:MAG: ATP-binding protein [Acidobacteriota bacterium]
MDRKKVKSSPAPECATCGGSGWVVKSREGVEQVARCSDCRPGKRLEKLLEGARIPPRYLNRGFESFDPTNNKSQQRALTRSIQYVEAFPNVPRGILFVGNCGVGKTHLCVAILEALIKEKSTAGAFVDETELLRRLQYSYGPDSPETERDVLIPLFEVELLVWDDLGTGRPTEWVAETIRTIINHRYTHRKHTIFSTNLPLHPRSDQTLRTEKNDPILRERLGAPLFSRIMEMCEVLEVKGLDFRTEVQKPKLDLEEAKARSSSVLIPDSLLNCPDCQSRKVTQLDQTRPKGSGRRIYIEVSCLCKNCAEHFLAHFFPKTAKVEYPSEL